MKTRLVQLWIRRRVLMTTIVVLAATGLVAGAVRLTRRGPGVPTFVVNRGEFLDSLQFRGEVKALKSLTISAPAEAGDLQIIKLSAQGAAVKPNDVVVDFDKTKTEQDLAQFRSAWKSAEATIDQARAQAKLAEEEDTTAVMKARFDVETAKLEASKQEIVSRIEGEEAKLKLADAEQKLREAEAKQSSDKALHGATVENTRQASGKAQYDMRRAEQALAKMTLRAPSSRKHQFITALGGIGHGSLPRGR